MVEEMTGTTFGNFWNWLTKDPALTELVGRIYAEPMGHFSIAHYVAQSKLPRKPPKDPDFIDRMQRLELYWGAEDTDGKLETMPCFHGWGEWDDEYTPKGTMGGFAVEFTPLNELMEYPLILVEEFEVQGFAFKTPAPADWKYGFSPAPIYKGLLKYSLSEVILGILYEITWAGTDGSMLDEILEAKDKVIKDLE